MPVDSFKYLPRLIGSFYQMTERHPERPIPWTPLPRPVSECKFGLVTSGGVYHAGKQQPFDLERELADPTWGDPTYRAIPSDIGQDEVGASHLHINTDDVRLDINILLPVGRLRELIADGHAGALARHVYSFMGYQGFPPDATDWQERYGPEVAERLKEEEVDCVLLTPA